jgi:transcriptional regulator with XRE-family HTH domain
MDGADLRTLRTSTGWNQELAAKKLKVTQAYLSMVERGNRPLLQELTTKVLRVFQVPPS